MINKVKMKSSDINLDKNQNNQNRLLLLSKNWDLHVKVSHGIITYERLVISVILYLIFSIWLDHLPFQMAIMIICYM